MSLASRSPTPDRSGPDGPRCAKDGAPAVILRKNSQSNRSDRGAATQAVLMSVYRTLRLRGLNPTKTIADALKTHLLTGLLPPLPA